MKIISAKYVKDYKIEIQFTDGFAGTLDLKEDLDKFADTKFFQLTDLENFQKFLINELGNIEWYNGWDYCKDTAYMKLNNVDIDNELEVMRFLKRYKNVI